jgi:3-dehydroquinate synthase
MDNATTKNGHNSSNGTNKAAVKTPRVVNRETVRVSLDKRSYNIHIERGILAHLGEIMLKDLRLGSDADGRVAAVLINPKIENFYGKTVQTSLEKAGFRYLPIVLIAGETYKTLQTVRRIYKLLYDEAVDRRTVIVAVGGGVIGDVAGYVAATYQRGLDFVQVPTTLLAQVDSSVGGKVGVNFEQAKNLIGAFYQPRVVVADPDTLKSLPFRERRSGLAEIIKSGAIADADFFHTIAGDVASMLRLTSSSLESAIASTIKIKAKVVEQDERDCGIRAILNFGHTVGHAIEALTGYHVYRHGEAVAIGMVSACLIGEEVGYTPPSTTEAILAVLQNAGFPFHLDERIYPNDVVRVTALDKKAVSGSAKFVLLERLGKATVGHDISNDIIKVALLRQRKL